MILLAANGTLAGGASVATQLTCTIWGMELNSSTKVETYKVLDQRQLAASPTTIYTATADGPTFVRSISVVNNDTTARTFQLFASGTAAANAITPVYSLSAGGSAVYEDGLGWQFFTSSGQQIVVGQAVPLYRMDNLGISGSKAETVPRNLCPEINATAATTGQVLATLIYINSGVTVTNISYWSATTAANGPTHWNFGLYDSSLNRLATGTDQTTTAWGANTLKTLAMQTPYVVTTTGVYYVTFMMTVSTTVPTLKGYTATTTGSMRAQAPALQGVSSTTYTTGDAPATIGSLTASTTLGQIWACVT